MGIAVGAKLACAEPSLARERIGSATAMNATPSRAAMIGAWDRPQGGRIGRRGVLRWGAALAALAAARPLRAAAADPLDAFRSIVETFAADAYGRKSAIAVAYHGRLVLAHGAAMDANAPVPLASLSKAVTALAVARLVTQGRLGFATTLAEALERFLAQRSPPADPRLRGVTVAQLLSYTAGLRTNDSADPTSGRQIADLIRVHGAEPRIPCAEIAANVLRFPLAREPGEAHAYSNAGYALLAQIVEEASEQPYDAFCRSEVLARAGVRGASAGISPRYAWRDGVGGWQMNLPQYLAFGRLFEAQPASLFGPAVKDALARSSAVVDAKRRITYLLGMYRRPGANGASVWWHTGLLQGPHGGKSMFVRSDLGASWIVWGAPGEGNTTTWDRAAWSAARSIQAWPEHDCFADFLDL